MIGLKSIEFFIPENLYPTRELAEVKNLTPPAQKIFDSLQIETVSIAEDFNNIEQAAEASKLAIMNANLTPDDIDLVIYLQGRTPEYLMSSEATAVQDRVGIKNAHSFTLTDLGCANISNALLVAQNFLKANPEMNNILICCGSKPISKDRYREAVTIIGDGGMGVIVGRTERNRIIDIKLITDGKYWDLWKIDYKKRLEDEYKEICTSPRYKFELAIASRNNFTELNEAICKENDVEKVDSYIMQNLSISAFGFNENAFKVKFAQSCYENCSKYGHLGSIDVLLNYKLGIRNGELKQGDIVLIMNNSPVACWSTILIEV